MQWDEISTNTAEVPPPLHGDSWEERGSRSSQPRSAGEMWVGNTDEPLLHHQLQWRWCSTSHLTPHCSCKVAPQPRKRWTPRLLWRLWVLINIMLITKQIVQKLKSRNICCSWLQFPLLFFYCCIYIYITNEVLPSFLYFESATLISSFQIKRL